MEKNRISINSPDKIILSEKKDKKIRIFIDMDGVVSNWEKAACDLLGIDDTEKELRDELKSGTKLEDTKHTNEEDMWKAIEKAGSDWWKNMSMFPWYKKLYNAMNKLGEVSFLTSNGNLFKHPKVAADGAKGKMECIYDNYQEEKPAMIVTHSKHFCANKDSILIDDSKKKVDAFKEWGGEAFLWPSAYQMLDGDLDVDNTIDELVEKIKDMKGS
jgi:hypothetical protein